MDLKQLLQEKRGIRHDTAKQYTRLVDRVGEACELCEIPDYAWLAEPDAMDVVFVYLDELSKDSLLLTTNALLAALNSLRDNSHPDVLGIKLQLQDRIKRANNMRTGDNMQQRLMGHEEKRWKTSEELYENHKLLEQRAMQRPDKFMDHLKYLLYAVYIHMQDTCVFRLDLVHKMAFGYRGDDKPTPNQVRLGKRGELAAFILTEYKTSGTYGNKFIEATPELTGILEDSYSRFPRPYLFPCGHDMTKPMKPSTASGFVKSCWVLTKTDDKGKPTADDIRSALTTRFFKQHPDLISRDRFAALSMSSTRTMEMNYLKLSALN